MLTDYEKRVYDYISSMGDVSSYELQKKFGKGETNIINNDNVVLAFNLKEKTAEAVLNLEDYGLIVGLPVSPLLCVFDGTYPDLPYAEKPPKGGYKTPHLMPLLYYTYTQAERSIRDRASYTKQEKEHVIKLMYEKRFEALTNYDKVHSEDWRATIKEELADEERKPYEA